MKKMMSILLAVMMAVTLAGTAVLAEDEALGSAQPEGGKKFESNWAFGGGLIQINYEEEGYRVYVDLLNNADMTGNIWEYACFYQEDNDALDAFVAVKRNYAVDPATGSRIDGEIEYEGFLEDGQEVLFTIDESGKLIWQEGRENAGADLEFVNIGGFDGLWTNDEKETWVDITWEGLDQERFYYTVFIQRGSGDSETVSNLTGRFNPETGKLECVDHEGGTPIAVFSEPADGRIVYEIDGGIELEYQILGSNG